MIILSTCKLYLIFILFTLLCMFCKISTCTYMIFFIIYLVFHFQYTTANVLKKIEWSVKIYIYLHNNYKKYTIFPEGTMQYKAIFVLFPILITSVLNYVYIWRHTFKNTQFSKCVLSVLQQCLSSRHLMHSEKENKHSWSSFSKSRKYE